MRRFIIFINLLLLVWPLKAQHLLKSAFLLKDEPRYFSQKLYGNGIVDLLTQDSVLWVSTGYGLSKVFWQSAQGKWQWRSFSEKQYLGKGGISAMALMDDSTLWIATAYDTTIDNNILPVGGGLSYTRDGGLTWHHVPQPVDSPDVMDYYPTTTTIQNLTYDIAFVDSTIWIASFGGGLRRSDDMGKTWQVVTTDNKFFSSYHHLNHRAFSLLSVDDTLWVGTAEGISKSTDNGQTWQRFRADLSSPDSISGNFVVALAYQPATHTVWAATVETDAGQIRGISRTSDWGKTWVRELTDERVFVHNFAFFDQWIFAPSDQGVFYKLGLNGEWQLIQRVQDGHSGNEILQKEFYSAATQMINGIPWIWLGGSDGLAAAPLTAQPFEWQVFRSYVSVKDRPSPAAYAYPSPFSPARHLFVRFEFSSDYPLTEPIKIYDFAMNPVATVPLDAYKPKWDGRNYRGDVVASGVYFFRVSLGGKVTWGKIVVIN